MNFRNLMDAHFRRSYLKEVQKRLPHDLKPQVTDICAEIDTQAAGLLQANQNLAVDAQAVSNMQLTSLALATYRVVQHRGMETRQALAFVKDVLVEPNRKRIQFGMRLMLHFSRDPLNMLATISENKETQMYGKAFEFERETDARQTYYHSTVKKCLYHDFFRANGAPELTAVFCSWDDLWGDLMRTGEYGVRFTRPATMGYGGDRCLFQFQRTPRGRQKA